MKTWQKAIVYPILGLSALVGISIELARTTPIVQERKFESKEIHIQHYKKINPRISPIFDCGFNLEDEHKFAVEKAKQMYFEGKGKEKTFFVYSLPYGFKLNLDTLIVFGGDTLKNKQNKVCYEINKNLSYYFEGYLSPKEILEEIENGKKAYEHGFWGSAGKLNKEDSILLKNLKKDLRFIVANPDSVKIDTSKYIQTWNVDEKLK